MEVTTIKRQPRRTKPPTSAGMMSETPYTPPDAWAPDTSFPTGLDKPRKVQTPTGELMDVIEKQDRTVWRGNEQVGTIDEQGRFVAAPPTAWEQLGEVGKEIGMGAVTGLSWLFKPFEYFHEYVGVPFAMAATAPWWSKEAPEITPGRLTTEDITAFFGPEGEFRKAYHGWNAPKYLRGALETIPWFFIPAVGQVGRAGVAARGVAGRLGQISPQLGKALEYSPYGLMEKGLAKIIEKPLKFGGKVYKRMTVQKDIPMPEPTPVVDLLASVAREHPERLRPVGVLGKPVVTTAQREKFRLSREAETTFRKVEVLRNEDRLLKESAVPTLMGTLMEKGDVATVFRLKEMPVPGIKLTHELVTHPGIKPKVKGASMALDDILANPSNYEWGINALPARRWAEQYYEIQNSLTRFWDSYIKRPIGKKPGEQYVHSLVTAQRNPKTGATLLEKEMYAAGTRGGVSGAAKTLKFKSEIEGIKAGYKYARPTQALAMQIEEYYNMTTFKRVMSLVDDLFEDPMKRMNKEIAETMQQYIKDIKFLGGGITRVTTAEGKVIIEKHPGLKALVQSVRRGEVPTSGMVGAVERRFPELGKGLRDALEITNREFDSVIKSLSDEVFTATKITRDKFREALTTVRLKKSAEKPLTEAGVPLGQRNVLAGELTETLESLGVEANKSAKFLSQLYRQAYKQTNVEREAALKQLLEATNREIARVKAESKAFAPQFRLAREAAIKTAFSEGRIVRLAGYQNKIIPDKTDWGMTGVEIADRLMKTLTPEKVNVALQTAGRMARMGVTLTAALDLSLIFIQGGVVLGHDVGRWARLKPSSAFFNMTKQMFKAIYNPKYQDEFIAKNFAIMKEMAENRGVIQKAVEYMRPEDIERLIRKGGAVGGFFGDVFKQSYGRFGAGFGSGSLAARTTIYKQMRESWLREGHSLTELGEFVNKVTGVISSAELGVSATQRAVESAGLFAPNYTRAYIMLVRDLVRGNKTASEARKAIAGMMAGGVVAYVGISEMVGQEPKLNPSPKALGGDGAEFMSFKIGNSIIGLPGFWYSAMRMIAAVTAAAEEDPEALLSLDWRENPTLRFLMSRSSPLVAVGREIIEQKDFLGRRLDEPDDWLRTMGVHFLSIAAQNLVTRNPSEEEGKFKRFGAEIFGLRTFPRGDWIRLGDMENEYAQKEFKKPFDDLNREQKDQVLEKYPEYKTLSDDARDKMVWESGEDFEQWSLTAEKLADVEYHGIGEQLANALFAGQIDYRTYLDEESTLHKIYQGRAKERAIIEEESDPDQAERWAKWREERPPEDKALDRYWEIRNDLRRTDTGQIDWDSMEKRVDEYLMGLDSGTRSYVLRMKDRRLRNLPPLMRKIAELQSQGREIVDEYYDQPEGSARVKYRRANPTIDAWLILMGRATTPQTEMAARLALEMAQQRGLSQAIFPKLAGEVTGQAVGAPAPARASRVSSKKITWR